MDTKRLLPYSDKLNEILRIYIEDINPFVIRFETTKGEFPVEIQNEIRAIYNHLARAALANDDCQIVENLDKMMSHSKRALIDCFKYMCVICDDNYRDFMKRYEAVDLTYLDEGRFLYSITTSRKQAIKAIRVAKEAESVNTSKEELFKLYQSAYNQFEDLNLQIDAAEDKAEFLKRKATRKDMISKASLVFGVIGIIIGIIGILF